jgi:hypothetical protein
MSPAAGEDEEQIMNKGHTRINRRTFSGAVAASLGAMAFAPGALTGRAFAAAQHAPSLEIVSPAAGDVVTSNTVEVSVAVENFTLDCAKSGRPDEPGVGPLHVMVDGMTMANLINFYCDETFTVPLTYLEPGPHTIMVGLSSNLHMNMMDSVQMVEIDYQPEDPQELPEANLQGAPAPTLVNLEDGETVPPVFAVEIEDPNFTVSEDLLGKPNIPGFGHWHVYIDTSDPMAAMEEAMMEMQAEMGTPAEGEMAPMPMPALALMPASNSFELDLSAWGPGEHSILITPAQNDHTPLAEFEPLMFTVVVDEDAS